jgi:hypothetical protein
MAKQRLPELTSLLDVLFILVFATLVALRAKPAVDEVGKTPEPIVVVPDAGLLSPDAGPPPDPGDALRMREATDRLVRTFQNPNVIVVTVSATGQIVGLSRRGAGATDVRVTLLRDSPDPERAIEYRGSDEKEHRVCEIARRELDLEPDLARALVVISTEKPLAELPYALVAGLMRDATRCMDDANGFALLVDPGKVEP